MNIIIITPNTNSKVTNLIFNSLISKGIDTKKINLNSAVVDLSSENWNLDCTFFDWFEEMKPDGIICRGIGTRKTKSIFFRVDLYRALEHSGIRVINSPQCLELATNKMLTSLILKKNGINTPETIVCENFKKALQGFHNLGGDVVLKPMYGSKGVGITRINDEGFAEYMLYNISRLDEPFYLQKYYEHQNTDIRAFCIGGQVVAAMERKSNNWRTNIAKGGIGTHIELPEEAVELSIKSSELVKGEITGVDLMKINGDYYVVEVNAIPGILGIQETTNLNISDEIAQYCIDEFRH